MFRLFSMRRFFVNVYLNVGGNKYEIGTDGLYKNESLWQSLSKMATQLPAIVGDGRDLSPEQQTLRDEFMFDGFLPMIKHLLRNHYNPADYPASKQLLRAAFTPVCTFAEKELPNLSHHSHLKVLFSTLVTLNNALRHAVPITLLTQISDKLKAYDAGVYEAPIMKQYVGVNQSIHR
jgi:hypothetical protein